MNIQEIQKLISKKYPGIYSEFSMQRILEGIEKLSQDLREELENFLITGKISNMEIEGYSMERLKKEHGMNEVAATLTLDWLKKEPEKAKESLKKGHDVIRIEKA